MRQSIAAGDFSRRNRNIDRLTTAVAILMSVYHFVSAQKLFVFSDIHVAIHICFALVIVFLQKMKLDGRRHPVNNSLMAALALASVAVTVFIDANYEAFKTSMGQNPPGKVLSGAILLAVLMVGTYLTWGKTIPVIVLIALAYGYFGPYMPGFLYHGGLSLDRVITYSTTNFTGVFGMLGTISANTIVLFSIFAGLMQAFGALDAIMNVAMAASGKVRSGAAQVAVLSSGLEDSMEKTEEILRAGLAESPGIIPLCHGGAIISPADALTVFRETSAAGFIGASSIERIPVEQAVSRTVESFKSLSPAGGPALR